MDISVEIYSPGSSLSSSITKDETIADVSGRLIFLVHVTSSVHSAVHYVHSAHLPVPFIILLQYCIV